VIGRCNPTSTADERAIMRLCASGIADFGDGFSNLNSIFIARRDKNSLARTRRCESVGSDSLDSDRNRTREVLATASF
jgi:hypothetical protein